MTVLLLAVSAVRVVTSHKNIALSSPALATYIKKMSLFVSGKYSNVIRNHLPVHDLLHRLMLEHNLDVFAM